MKERTLRHLTNQHLHRHLSAVNILVVHAFCSHISTSGCNRVWDTLIVLWHLRLIRTLQFPYVYRFLQSCVGTTRAHLAVYSFTQPKYRVPAESTKNDIFIRTNATAGTSLLFGFRGVFYLHSKKGTKSSTWCSFPSGDQTVTSVSYLFPCIENEWSNKIEEIWDKLSVLGTSGIDYGIWMHKICIRS